MSDSYTEFDEAYDVEEPKRLRLSLHIIVKRNLPPEASKWPQDKIVEALNRISHLRLDRENISQIDSLELLGNSVTNAYLQHNRIERIENMESLTHLTFLTLAHNKIRKLEGIAHLTKLALLDLSENLIQHFDIDEVPQSLVILNLSDNPCTHISDYRGRIIQDLPRLRQLDGAPVSKEERREVGFIVSSSSEEEEEEEEEEERPSVGMVTGPLSINDVFKTTTSDILLRSQSRLEQTLKEHKQKLGILEDIRAQSNIPSLTDASSARSQARRKPQGHSEGHWVDQ